MAGAYWDGTDVIVPAAPDYLGRTLRPFSVDPPVRAHHAYRPATNSYRDLAAPSSVRTLSVTAWTGRALLSVGPSAANVAVLDSAAGAWLHVPAPWPGTPLSQLVWTGDTVLGWAHDRLVRYQPPPQPATATVLVPPPPRQEPVEPGRCGRFPTDGAGVFGDARVTPATTTPPGPADGALGARLLGAADLGCAPEATIEAVDPGAPQFRPCGFAFGDTSRAAGHARALFEMPVPASVGYVEEVVARFPDGGGAAELDGFRAAIAECPRDQQGRLTFTDVPRFGRSDGGSEPTEWSLRPVEILIAGGLDDAVVVEFSYQPGAYVLAALRSGDHVAFVRTFFEHGHQQAVTALVAAAASRLGG